MNILDDVAFNLLKRNIESNMLYYIQYKSPWVQDVVDGLNDDDLSQDSTLIISSDSSNDALNAIKIYEKYRWLSLPLASSNHFWTTLAHTEFYNYMQARWPVDESTKPNYIDSRYFLSITNQKSRARHGLARLWWIAHLTYDDKNEEDPYYYTYAATEDQELYNLIMETKHVAQNKIALFAMLDVVKELLVFLKTEGIEIFNKRNFYRNMMQQINLIGSVAIWDMLTRREAKEKLEEYAMQYLNINKSVYADIQV